MDPRQHYAGFVGIATHSPAAPRRPLQTMGMMPASTDILPSIIIQNDLRSYFVRDIQPWEEIGRLVRPRGLTTRAAIPLSVHEARLGPGPILPSLN